MIIDVRAHCVPPSSLSWLEHGGANAGHTIVHDADALGLLVGGLGADHVMPGSDHPFELGDDDPVSFGGSLPDRDEAGRTAIPGAIAAGLLGR